MVDSARIVKMKGFDKVVFTVVGGCVEERPF
jgi:hypothetical protein